MKTYTNTRFFFNMQGDSGSPMIINRNGEYVALAVLSSGTKFGHEYYTRILPQKKFIEKHAPDARWLWTSKVLGDFYFKIFKNIHSYTFMFDIKYVKRHLKIKRINNSKNKTSLFVYCFMQCSLIMGIYVLETNKVIGK